MGNADSKNDAAMLATENLDLSHKKLTVLPAELRRVVNLITLCISNNELADIATLDNKRLQELDASFNRIDQIAEYLSISNKSPVCSSFNTASLYCQYSLHLPAPPHMATMVIS